MVRNPGAHSLSQYATEPDPSADWPFEREMDLEPQPPLPEQSLQHWHSLRKLGLYDIQQQQPAPLTEILNENHATDIAKSFGGLSLETLGQRPA
jgi:hypothetical protein